jgi:Na+-translocating ferredoxin:NAD+ oxidoreductase subunit B
MNDEVYYRLSKVLDTLPNGFPPTESGVEIRLLKKVFTPEQADLFCDMRLTFETAEEIASRTGRPLPGLENKLTAMSDDGQLFAIQFGQTRFFKMLPWAFGIYEFQLGRIDREFAELCDEYMPTFGRQFFSESPQLMQVLPIEEKITVQQEALSYERVSALIDRSESFLVNDCICKKEEELLGKPCDKPLQVCLALAPVPGIFDQAPHGRIITKSQAYELIKAAEEAGLVHMTGNVRNGQIYICNCCGCCCGVLKAINKLGIPASQVVNSHYYAEIDPDKCLLCGTCSHTRCQVGAIEEGEEASKILQERCIGCGLCVSTCPGEAIRLIHKGAERITPPPETEIAWFEERGSRRGVDFSSFK